MLKTFLFEEPAIVDLAQDGRDGVSFDLQFFEFLQLEDSNGQTVDKVAVKNQTSQLSQLGNSREDGIQAIVSEPQEGKSRQVFHRFGKLHNTVAGPVLLC
jgi:hypothetical protein